VARNMYGATSADFTLTSGGRVVPGATLTIWSARTGGTQITDLLDRDSVATTTVTSDADGSIVYYGPNNDKTVHWADSGVGNRIAIRPVDITGDPPVLSIGTVGTGAAAANLTGTSEAPVLNLTLPSAGANGVNTAAIQNDAVTADKIAANAVGSSELADNAVDTAALADGSVTSAKIAGRALTALTPDAVLSSNLGPAIGSWTAVGSATFSTGTWTVPTGSGISATIAAVTDATIYQVDVTQSAGAPLTVTLGSVTQIFGDWQNSVTVVSSGTGSQTLTVTVGSSASITGVTVRSVITPASPIGLGQVEARLRTYNNAIGVDAQYSLTTGSYNTALGHSAGSNITVQSGTVCIGVDYSGTAAQASADNDFVLGTGLHKVLIPGSLETTGNDKGVIVRSPNGTRWRLGVSNAGAVTVVAA